MAFSKRRNTNPALRAVGALFRWAWKLVAFFAMLLPAAVIDDSHGHVEPDPKGWEQGRPNLSVALWVLGLPWLIFGFALALPWPLITWPLLALELFLALFFLGRRVSASRGHEMSAGQWFQGMRTVLAAPRTEVGTDGESVPARRPLAHSAASTTFAFGALIVVLAAATGILTIAGPLVAFLAPYAPTLAWYPAAGFAGWLLICVTSMVVGRLNTPDEDDEGTYTWQMQLARVFSVSDSEWARGGGSHTFSPDLQTLTVVPSIGARGRTLAEIEAACARIIPSWTCVHLEHSEAEFVPVEQRPDVLRARELIAQSDGLIIATEQMPSTPARPGAQRLRLNPASRIDLDGLARFVGSQRRDLVSVDLAAGEAVTAKLPQITVQTRARMAEKLGVRPWELEIRVVNGEEHVETVEIISYPNAKLGNTAEKRLDRWQELLTALADATNGWTICEDSVTGRVTMTYGKQLKLPARVSIDEVLPAITDDPDAWSQLPLGIGPAGTPVGLDLQLGPHTLIAGPTGSGKTVAILTLAVDALTRGFDLALIDPTKDAVDFASLVPWTIGFGDTYQRSMDLIKAIYAEGVRRKSVLKKYMEVKWNDLAPEIREREGIRPLLLIVDELGAMLVQPSIPKALGKEDPEYIEAVELAGQKEMLRAYIGKIAREQRFVGIHLCLATQRPDVSVLGDGFGEIRQNLTSRVQLKRPGSALPLETIKMCFAAEDVDEAYRALKDLDDGHSRGLAAVAGDGGELTAIRVAFQEMKGIPDLLAARGIARPARRLIESRSQNEGDTVVDEMEFSLDDLEGLDDEPTPDPFAFSLDDEPIGAKS